MNFISKMLINIVEVKMFYLFHGIKKLLLSSINSILPMSFEGVYGVITQALHA